MFDPFIAKLAEYTLRKEREKEKLNSEVDLPLGGIHKLRHTLRGAEGVDEVRHCVTRWGGILNFVTSHFKNSITGTQLSSRGWVDPVPHLKFVEVPGIEPATS